MDSLLAIDATQADGRALPSAHPPAQHHLGVLAHMNATAGPVAAQQPAPASLAEGSWRTTAHPSSTGHARRSVVPHPNLFGSHGEFNVSAAVSAMASAAAAAGVNIPTCGMLLPPAAVHEPPRFGPGINLSAPSTLPPPPLSAAAASAAAHSAAASRGGVGAALMKRKRNVGNGAMGIAGNSPMVGWRPLVPVPASAPAPQIPVPVSTNTATTITSATTVASTIPPTNSTIMSNLSPLPSLLTGPPEAYLHGMLRERGYSVNFIASLSSRFYTAPTTDQMQSYDIELVRAIRSCDVGSLERLRASGRSMAACNKYGESILHMACRRSDFVVLQFLLASGASIGVSDDFGRTPLHDACWTTEPCFEVVQCLLDREPELLFAKDLRGSSPLQYVRQEHWAWWCAFFDYKKEAYWPTSGGHAPSTAAPSFMGAPVAGVGGGSAAVAAGTLAALAGAGRELLPVGPPVGSLVGGSLVGAPRVGAPPASMASAADMKRFLANAAPAGAAIEGSAQPGLEALPQAGTQPAAGALAPTADLGALAAATQAAAAAAGPGPGAPPGGAPLEAA